MGIVHVPVNPPKIGGVLEEVKRKRRSGDQANSRHVAVYRLPSTGTTPMEYIATIDTSDKLKAATTGEESGIVRKAVNAAIGQDHQYDRDGNFLKMADSPMAVSAEEWSNFASVFPALARKPVFRDVHAYTVGSMIRYRRKWHQVGGRIDVDLHTNAIVGERAPAPFPPADADPSLPATKAQAELAAKDQAAMELYQKELAASAASAKAKQPFVRFAAVPEGMVPIRENDWTAILFGFPVSPEEAKAMGIDASDIEAIQWGACEWGNKLLAARTKWFNDQVLGHLESSSKATVTK